MRRDAFSGYHPVVNLTYFVLVLAFAMTIMHPVYMAISLLGALGYAAVLGGPRRLLRSLAYMVPGMLLMMVMNPLFNHQGATILAYMYRGNPLTLESIIYGAVTGAMFVTVICWFTSVTRVITGEKIIYLFGRVIPALSLVLSMVMRFVPAFREKLREVSDAQKVMGRAGATSLTGRIRHGLKLFSIMVTWALENAIDTVDSMRSRGYGLPGRTAYSIYRFDRRDLAALAAILACGGLVLALRLAGAIRYWYFPLFYVAPVGPVELLGMAAYALLCAAPIVLYVWEGRKWHYSPQNS